MTGNTVLIQILSVETDPMKCAPFQSKQKAILSHGKNSELYQKVDNNII